MVLKQVFELIYDSNHLFCLNFKIACTYFRIKSYFKTCLNTPIQFTYCYIIQSAH